MKGTAPKPFVFVLMPFDENFHDIYHLGIKPACEAAGAYCERVDEQIYDGTITQRIYNQIAKADLVVADMTGKNPNVFYETGYAHALNKRVILLTQRAEDIPFDLKDYPHIVYGRLITDLKGKLERRVRWSLEHPSDTLARVDVHLEIMVNGVLLDGEPEIGVSGDAVWDEDHRGRFSHAAVEFNVNIHNASKRVYENLRLALVVPSVFTSASMPYPYLDHPALVQLPQGEHLWLLRNIARLVPSAWEPNPVRLVTHDVSVLEQTSHPVVVTIYTDLGSLDFKFILRLNLCQGK